MGFFCFLVICRGTTREKQIGSHGVKNPWIKLLKHGKKIKWVDQENSDHIVASILHPLAINDDEVGSAANLMECSSQNTTRATDATKQTQEQPQNADVPVSVSEDIDLETNVEESLAVEATRATNDDSVRPGTSKQSLTFPLATISPAPQGQFIRGQGKRKLKPVKGHWLLTSTPNMEEAIAKNRPKDPPEQKKRQVKKTLFDDGKSNQKNASKNTLKKAPEKRQRAKRQRKTAHVEYDSGTEDFTAETEDDDDCPCIYCNDLYSRSKPGESWLRCMNCSRWAHASCADVPKKTKRFICELCS